MKKLSSFRILLCVFFVVSMFSACNKTENLSPTNNVNTTASNGRAESEPFLLKYENLHPKVQVSFVYYDTKNGFLHFSDHLIFDKIRTELMNKDNETLAKWQGQFEGFTSLQCIYAKAIEVQEAEIQNLISLSGNKKKSDSPSSNPQFYSDFVKQHKEKFVFEGDGFFKLNVALIEVACLTNAEGLVKISGDIFQFTNNAIKILKGGKVENIPALKKAVKDDGKGIIVKNIIRKNSISNGRVESSSCQNSSIVPNIWHTANSGYFNSCFGEIGYELPIYDYSYIAGYVCDGSNFFCYPLYSIIGYESKTRLDGNCWAVAHHWLYGGVSYPLLSMGLASTYNVGFGNIDFLQFSPLYVSSFSATVYDGARVNSFGFSKVYCRDFSAGDRNHYYYF